MVRSALRFAGLSILLLLCWVDFSRAVPIPSDTKPEIITERKNFFPYRQHQELPGKMIAVLLTNGQPILSKEGRSGPADQLCISQNGGSYRWVYVAVTGTPMIGTLQIAVPGGKNQAFPNLSMASPTTVKPMGVDKLYSLVEVEVNGGVGSPAGQDAFVATNFKALDGTKEFPIKVAEVVADLAKKYETYLADNVKEHDRAMEDSRKQALKDKPSTGPRESSTLMYLTWLPKEERLQVRFHTMIQDGAYDYARGLRIELRPGLAPRPGPAGGGPAPIDPLPNGLRTGTQFGIELGRIYEVSKTGKIERIQILPPAPFSKFLPVPPR